MDNQRLFRLTSQSNDGVFDTLFNEDIEIAAGSEIALQSASFERQSARVTINGTNSTIKYSLQEDKQWTAGFPSGTFSQLQDGETLLTAAQDEMNLTVDMEDPAYQITEGGFLYSIDRGSQWRAQLDGDGKTEITAKTNEPVMASDEDFKTDFPDQYAATTVLAGVDAPTLATTTPGDSSYMSRDGPVTTQGSYNESYVYGKLRMVKGTGCIRARLNEIGAAVTGNGILATIGLVNDYSKLTSGTIADADIIWGLQVLGNDTNYRYKAGGGTATWQDAGVQPSGFAPAASDENDNDVLEIVIGGVVGNVYGGVSAKQSVSLNIHKSDGATFPDIDQTLFQDGSVDYYYFISYHAVAADIKLDMIEADLDPYLSNQTNTSHPGDSISTLATVVRSGFANQIPATKRQGLFEFATAEVGEFFGFAPGKPAKIPAGTGSAAFAQSQLYTFVSETRAEFSVRAKNYLVLFDELPLNSYDSYARFDVAQRNANSGGSRRNLLATVPTTEDQLAGTSVTQIAFEPSTLDYISLRNTSPVLTRRLGCRILTSTYEPIEIDGLASLTVLIRQKGSSCH